VEGRLWLNCVLDIAPVSDAPSDVLADIVASVCYCFRPCVLFGLCEPEDREDISPKRQLAFSGLYGVTLKKIVPVFSFVFYYV
jgi:hypothetical protein